MFSRIKSRIKGNRFFSNVAWSVLGKAVQMALKLIVVLITARYLGPNNYGVIEYTASYVVFFTDLAGLGFTGIAVKELLEKPEEQGKTLGTMIFFRICSSVLSSAAIVVLVFFLDQGDALIVKVAFLQSLSLVFQSFEMIDYWYQSRLEAKTSVKIQTAAYIVMASYKVAILVLQKDVTWFACTTALETLVVAVLLLISYYRRRTQRFEISFGLGKNMLKQSYHFVLSGIMVTLYCQMDRVMLKQMLDESVVGLYSAAMTISTMWGFVVNILIYSAQPLIITSKKSDEKLYIKQLKRLYAAIIWIGIFVASGISFCARWVVEIMYGSEYLPAAPILVVSVWYTIFAMVGNARGIWMVCENKAKYLKYYAGIGAIVNVILNYLLIPVWGASGAAVATLITQFVTAIVGPALFKETRIHTRYVMEAFLLRGIK